MKWDMSKEEEDIDQQVADLEKDVEATTDNKKEEKGDIDDGDYWD